MKKQDLIKLIEKIEKIGIENVKKELLQDIPKHASDITQDLQNLLGDINFDYLKVFLIEKDCIITMHNDRAIMYPKKIENAEIKIYYRKIDTSIDKSIDQS